MATKTRPTINATDRRIAAAKTWLAAKAAAEAAEAALKEARETLLRVVPDGEGVLEFDGGKVLFDNRSVPSYDVEALVDLVDDETLEFVTERKVKSTAWKASVDSGLITDDVVDAVVSLSTSRVVKEG
jgi:hypothetical protein